MHLKKIKSHMSQIVEITELISKEQDFYAVKDKIIDIMLQVIACRMASIVVIPQEDSQYGYLVCTKTIESFAHRFADNLIVLDHEKIFKIPLQDFPPYVQDAVQMKKTMYVDDLSQYYSYSKICNEEEGAIYHGKAIFPIIFNDLCIGFISCYMVEEEYLDEDDIYFVKEVASLLGFSIEMTRLSKIILESQMREKELAMTFDMQQNIMSDNHIHFTCGATIDFKYKYGESTDYFPSLSKRLGGDYCEIIKISEEEALIFIADVMGHGMSANYFVPMMKGVLKTLVSEGVVSPGLLLERMNRLLIKELDKANLFITARALHIDFNEGWAISANAGHTQPIAFPKTCKSHEYTLLDQDRGLPLGIDDTEAYEEAVYSLDGYDTLVLYTDGIIEVINEQGEEFGTDGIAQFFYNKKEENGRALCEGIYQQISHFSDHDFSRMEDDIMIVVIRLCRQKAETENRMEVS